MAKEVPSGTSFHLHKNVGLNVGLFMIFDCNTYYVVVLINNNRIPYLNMHKNQVDYKEIT